MFLLTLFILVFIYMLYLVIERYVIVTKYGYYSPDLSNFYNLNPIDIIREFLKIKGIL